MKTRTISNNSSCVAKQRRFALGAALALGLLALPGCEPSTLGMSYLAVNHTTVPIDSFTINGEGGVTNVPAMGGGGKIACCVVIPKRWHPGLKVTVRWQPEGYTRRDANGNVIVIDGIEQYVPAPWKERTVEMQPYTEEDLGGLHVHFMPNDQVIVKVSKFYPEYPGYQPPYPEPLPGKQ